MHGSWFDRARLYPPLLEMEFDSVYNEGRGTGFMKRIAYPLLEESLAQNDFRKFRGLMPFVRRFAERIGYTP